MLTDRQYRTLPRYANSDLSELATVLFAKPRIKTVQAALDFGTAFHTLILEPDRFDPVSNLGFMPILNWMKESLETDSELIRWVANSEREIIRQWTCPLTGLPLKSKLDACVLPKRKHLIDLKTTSCTSLAKFEQSCYEYDYDRQAAFYLSSDPDATFFEFVGVQKAAPYWLFRLTFHKDDEFIVYGRKKVDFLLRKAKEEAKKEDGWRPGSWNRKEVIGL